ncbi:MAG: hypothetical protein JWM46_252 [Candidatus Kaiserbacteria bacterium]|nr:hypothetical protein [Candidatus Kaiserbacteria bacterium]
MIKTILTYVIAGMIIVLVCMWLWTGGWALIKQSVRNMPNPIDIIWGNSSSTYAIVLPGQPPIPQGPDISNLTDQYADSGTSNTQDISPEERQAQQQAQNNAIRAQAQAAQHVNDSPYAGVVSLSSGTASDKTQTEYLTLDANQQIPVGGWSLVSTMTGMRATIPAYSKGPQGSLVPTVMRSGDTAIVVSATSPAASAISASWHVYLNAGTNIWSDSHDTIQLLDASGRIVDTISY